MLCYVTKESSGSSDKTMSRMALLLQISYAADLAKDIREHKFVTMHFPER